MGHARSYITSSQIMAEENQFSQKLAATSTKQRGMMFSTM